MAALATRKCGARSIQFTDREGRRRTLSLGKIPLKNAKTIQYHVKELVHASLSGDSPSPGTSCWLAEIGDALHDKLARFGLVGEREKAHETAKTLKELLDWFIDVYGAGGKERTLSIWKQARRSALAYFEPDIPIGEITRGAVDLFVKHLATSPRTETDPRPLAKNTYNKRLSILRQAFNQAIRHRWLDENPFGDLKGLAVRADKSKQFFVSRENIELVLAACPNAEWRAIVSLARYCGCRVPSEVFSLKWEHVIWEQDRLVIPQPKLAHIEGCEERICPLFAPVREALEELDELAEPGAVYVLGNRYRDAGRNLRTQFRRIILKAGLKPWARPFHNLRLSAQTELSAILPPHAVCAFLGNSPEVAREHYLVTRDEDFATAMGLFTAPESLLRNPLQSAAHLQRRESPVVNTVHAKTLKNYSFSGRRMCTKYTPEDSNL